MDIWRGKDFDINWLAFKLHVCRMRFFSIKSVTGRQVRINGICQARLGLL